MTRQQLIYDIDDSEGMPITFADSDEPQQHATTAVVAVGDSEYNRAIDDAVLRITAMSDDMTQHKSLLLEKPAKARDDWTRISYLQITTQVLANAADALKELKILDTTLHTEGPSNG